VFVASGDDFGVVAAAAGLNGGFDAGFGGLVMGRKSYDVFLATGGSPGPALPAYVYSRTLPEGVARLWGSGRLDVAVDANTGLRLSSSCTLPHARRDLAIARWPSLAYPWLPIAERRAAQVPGLSPDCEADALAAMETLRIDGPADGSAIARAPNSVVPAQVRVRALGTNGKVRWLVNGAWVGESTGGGSLSLAFPIPGEQRITAMADGGAWAEMGLRVLA